MKKASISLSCPEQKAKPLKTSNQADVESFIPLISARSLSDVNRIRPPIRFDDTRYEQLYPQPQEPEAAATSYRLYNLTSVSKSDVGNNDYANDKKEQTQASLYKIFGNTTGNANNSCASNERYKSVTNPYRSPPTRQSQSLCIVEEQPEECTEVQPAMSGISNRRKSAFTTAVQPDNNKSEKVKSETYITFDNIVSGPNRSYANDKKEQTQASLYKIFGNTASNANNSCANNEKYGYNKPSNNQYRTQLVFSNSCKVEEPPNEVAEVKSVASGITDAIKSVFAPNKEVEVRRKEVEEIPRPVKSETYITFTNTVGGPNRSYANDKKEQTQASMYKMFGNTTGNANNSCASNERYKSVTNPYRSPPTRFSSLVIVEEPPKECTEVKPSASSITDTINCAFAPKKEVEAPKNVKRETYVTFNNIACGPNKSFANDKTEQTQTSMHKVFGNTPSNTSCQSNVGSRCATSAISVYRQRSSLCDFDVSSEEVADQSLMGKVKSAVSAISDTIQSAFIPSTNEVDETGVIIQPSGSNTSLAGSATVRQDAVASFDDESSSYKNTKDKKQKAVSHDKKVNIRKSRSDVHQEVLPEPIISHSPCPIPIPSCSLPKPSSSSPSVLYTPEPPSEPVVQHSMFHNAATAVTSVLSAVVSATTAVAEAVTDAVGLTHHSEDKDKSKNKVMFEEACGSLNDLGAAASTYNFLRLMTIVGHDQDHRQINPPGQLRDLHRNFKCEERLYRRQYKAFSSVGRIELSAEPPDEEEREFNRCRANQIRSRMNVDRTTTPNRNFNLPTWVFSKTDNKTNCNKVARNKYSHHSLHVPNWMLRDQTLIKKDDYDKRAACHVQTNVPRHSIHKVNRHIRKEYVHYGLRVPEWILRAQPATESDDDNDDEDDERATCHVQSHISQGLHVPDWVVSNQSTMVDDDDDDDTNDDDTNEDDTNEDDTDYSEYFLQTQPVVIISDFSNCSEHKTNKKSWRQAPKRNEVNQRRTGNLRIKYFNPTLFLHLEDSDEDDDDDC